MKFIHFALIVSLICSCEQTKKQMNLTDQIIPPIAEKIPFKIVEHDTSRTDDYFWMRLTDEQKEAKTMDDITQKVVSYLKSENDYTEKLMEPFREMREGLYKEIISRIEQKDESVPYTKNGYEYYSIFEEGEDYPKFFRKNKKNHTEQLLIDGPILAKNKKYFAIGGISVSHHNELMCYGVDTVSRRQYTLYFKNLINNTLLTDQVENTTGNAVWANDGKTVFYTRQDELTLRSNQIYKHVIGTDPSQDVLVYEEKDETFECSVSKSKSGQYLFIESSQTVSTEVRFLNANNIEDDWSIISPRKRGHEYQVFHFEDNFYIISNLNAKNFRLMRTNINETDIENWKEVIPHREETLLESIEIFKDFYVVEERTNGLTKLKVFKWNTSESYFIDFNDPTYSATIGNNPEFDSETFRFGYSSLTTPYSTYDFNMRNRTKELKKQTKVIDEHFSSDNYISERLMAPANDGTLIPISLVYKKGLSKNKSNPTLLYGYGSYGISMDPYFSSVRLSLLDRGFVFAIAHIRGGQEMGRDWYEQGKLLNKMNTFTDFINCAEYLINQNFTSTDHLYAQGGSAGGLLMGAVINMRPDLWNGILAGVPFVDVMSTMWDESIPLTTGEFDEWGNPKDKEYYDYMMKYSPYDNVIQQAYPNMLITTGYWDSQVQYWEPAKWIAKLRANKTNENILLMHCDMDAGHGGASGRFKRYEEIALEYAFLFKLEGIKF